MPDINSINNKTDTLTIESAGEGVLQTDGSGVVSGSKGTDGQVLISSTSGSPSWASITSTGASITITPGSNSINLESAGGSGGGVKITKFTSSDTWTKDGDAQMIEYHVWQGGAGGGGGAASTSSTASGGGGGSAGCYLYSSAPAFMYPSSASVVIGSGASGGAGTMGTNNGQPGSDSTTTSFLAFDGSNQVASGGPGGTSSAVGPATQGAWYHPFSALESDAYKYVPLAGTGELTAGGNAAFLGGSSFKFGRYCCAGSGGGGGGASAGNAYAGGNGSGIYATIGGTLAAGATGGTANGGHGADGANNTDTSAGVLHGGLGGGGGGSDDDEYVLSGNGGDGGIPGGGGGGGGGKYDPFSSTASGWGGSGGRGEVLVIEYLG